MFAAEDEPRDNEACRRLIAAASEEFARHGLASARVRKIADAAKVNLAAVNYYFGGKEGLYRATLRYLAGHAQPAGLVAARRGIAPEERLRERVFALLDRFGANRPSPLGRILAHEAMNPTAQHDSLLAETMRSEIERIREVLRQIAGSAASESDLAHTALGIVGHCLLYLYARPALDRIFPGLTDGPDACECLARQITEFSLGGIERFKQTRAAAE